MAAPIQLVSNSLLSDGLVILAAADFAGLMKAGISHPAMPYYLGRRRVAAALAANGGDVDALFAGPS